MQEEKEDEEEEENDESNATNTSSDFGLVAPAHQCLLQYVQLSEQQVADLMATYNSNIQAIATKLATGKVTAITSALSAVEVEEQGSIYTHTHLQIPTNTAHIHPSKQVQLSSPSFHHPHSHTHLN